MSKKYQPIPRPYSHEGYEDFYENTERISVMIAPDKTPLMQGEKLEELADGSFVLKKE